MRIFDREYEFRQLHDNEIKFLIDGKDGSECKGRSFYKYYSLEHYNVDALTHLYVYATHPCKLNDPLDCAEALISYDHIECAKILWEDIYSSVADFFHNNDKEILAFTNKAYRTLLYTKLGILSLSTKWDDLSMWAAYCSHKGFCVEFNILDFPFKTIGPFHVNYQEKLTSVSIAKCTMPVVTLVQTNVKLKCWEHEDEWRLLIQNPQSLDMEPFGEWSTEIKKSMPDYHDRKFRYPIKCIKSVTLGLEFFNGLHEIISYDEVEIVATEDLQSQVLTFLAFSKVPTYWLRVVDLFVYRQPVKICKIRENTYRITTN